MNDENDDATIGGSSTNVLVVIAVVVALVGRGLCGSRMAVEGSRFYGHGT